MALYKGFIPVWGRFGNLFSKVAKNSSDHYSLTFNFRAAEKFDGIQKFMNY